MMISGQIKECDFSQVKFDDYVDGVHCLARGATGRVCCVMHASLEYAKEAGWKIASREEAEEWAEKAPGGSVDF